MSINMQMPILEESNDNGPDPIEGNIELPPLDKYRQLGAAPGFTSAPFQGSSMEVDEQIPDDDAVMWLWQKIELDGFQKESWREEHGFIIADFLASPTISRLVVFLDDNGRLSMQTDASVLHQSGRRQLQYFIKDPGAIALSSNEVRDQIQYGIISGNVLENIFHLMTNVFAPSFLGNKTWPVTVRKEFTGHIHKFMANLTETVHNILATAALLTSY